MLRDIILTLRYVRARYWSVAVPMYMLVCVAFVLLLYWAVNLRNTEPLDSMFTITGLRLSCTHALLCEIHAFRSESAAVANA